MELRVPAIVCSAHPHGEVGVIVRLLTPGHGLVAGYVAGGRGRVMRPVLIPGNVVAADLRWRMPGGLATARLELMASRGAYMTEPLAAAAILWATSLTASALPERHDYPPLYPALAGLLDAVCHAPSARGWAGAVLAYEGLVLRELGYGRVFGAGGDGQRHLAGDGGDWPAFLAAFDAGGAVVARYLLADRARDVMGAREALRDRLVKIGAA